jgi:hypothetical protein
LWREAAPSLLPYRRATLNHSILELNFRADSLGDRMEFHNPCSALLVSADAQSFAVHRLPANLEYGHRLVDALAAHVELS